MTYVTVNPAGPGTGAAALKLPEEALEDLSETGRGAPPPRKDPREAGRATAMPVPVIVYGALRSGTTVFRLMLDSHPGIGNPGEADFLFDHLHREPGYPTGWRYDLVALRRDRIFQSKNLVIPVTPDGVPFQGLGLLRAFLQQLARQAGQGRVFTLNVHRHVDRIAEVLPETRIIHLLRDPRDVARSSIGMGWASHLYHGVDHWIATETAWERSLPALGRAPVLTLRYEDLLGDIEAGLKEVCGFLGVPWAAAMLRYHETSSYGPPDPALAGQWRRKCDPDHIALLEGKVGALMRRRGYRATGSGRRPGFAERRALWLRHKAGLWRFGIRRHGAIVFLGEKLARWGGLPKLQTRFRNRMNATEKAALK